MDLFFSFSRFTYHGWPRIKFESSVFVSGSVILYCMGVVRTTSRCDRDGLFERKCPLVCVFPVEVIDWVDRRVDGNSRSHYCWQSFMVMELKSVVEFLQCFNKRKKGWRVILPYAFIDSMEKYPFSHYSIHWTDVSVVCCLGFDLGSKGPRNRLRGKNGWTVWNTPIF